MHKRRPYPSVSYHDPSHVSLSYTRIRKSILGFTIVELIVVVSILGILGLMAFTSITGYVSSARDAVRAADISSLFRGMETAVIKNGAYPTPDNAFTVAYSGGSVWMQGTAGDSVFRIMDSVGVRSSKKLTDPLLGTEYGYATLAYGKAYQFRADWEGDALVRSDPTMTSSVYAAPGNPTIAYIKGNYTGYVAKTLTGGMTCILAVPSLIVSQSGAALTGSVDFLSLSNRFLMHGQSNTQGVKFTPQPGLCFSNLPTDDSRFGITNIMRSLQNAYTGTDLVSNPSISSILSTQSGALVTLGIPILEMGLNIDITGTAYPDPSVYSSGTVYSPTGNSSFIWSGTTVHATGGGIGFASSRADPLCDTNDISVWQPGTNNVQIWAACNVGATVASAGTTTQSCTTAGCSVDTFTGAYAASLANFGSYFQWGNNTPITYLPNTAGTGSRSTTCSGTNDSTYSGATNFILTDNTPPAYDWCANQNNNLWGNGTNTATARIGPCPTGYHVPTQSGSPVTNAYDW